MSRYHLALAVSAFRQVDMEGIWYSFSDSNDQLPLNTKYLDR